MTDDDRELVSRTLRGDRAAFEGLVARYQGLAAAIARALAGNEAEDLVQEAFLQAYASLADLRDGTRFRAWFTGIVRSKAIDWLRHRRASPEVPAGPTGPEPETRESPSERIEREETVQRIWEALDTLPEAYREVVVLRHWGRLSYDEIARETGSTVPAVESRLFRARQALKKHLGPELS
ncbi:MAG: RNA polymerase sigma factor [Planctomycetes bacterium]|nr:RNA polymerase sigma factor [Planctomycetota bacterium]